MSRSVRRFLSKNKRVAGMAIGAIAMLAVAGPALAQDADAFKVTAAINPGAKPLVSFDISWFDPKLKKYFLADRSNNQIDIVDPSNNSVTHIAQGLFGGVGADSDHSGPDGVLTVHRGEDEDEGGVTEVWVGDFTPPTGPGRVWVLDASSGAVLFGPISTGGTTRADELCFDPKHKLIMIASPGEDPPYVTFISTKTHTVVTKLTFDGKNGTPDATGGGLEQCGWSPKTKKFYQNVPQIATNPKINGVKAGGISVIDPKDVSPSGANVEKTLPVDINDCALPQGMAIGPDNQIMLGCNGPSPNGHRNTAMVDINSGATLKAFADLGGADEVWFNKGDGHYFFPSCNTACRPAAGTTPGGPEVLGIVDSSGRQKDVSVTIATTLGTTATSLARRAHSVAADPDTLQVYVPLPACFPNAAGECPLTRPPASTVPLSNDATMCETAGIQKVGSPTRFTGCILVLKGTPDADDRVAERENDQGENDNSQD